jgi:hypothetical protein
MTFSDFAFPYVRDSSLLPGRKPAHAMFSSSIAILECSYVDVRAGGTTHRSTQNASSLKAGAANLNLPLAPP